MKLTDLKPKWFAEAGNPDIVGITFDCPHCQTQRLGVAFKEEIDRDGLPNDVHWSSPGLKWHREGDTFETLSLSPSVDASQSGHWHGYIKNGSIE